MIGLSYRYLGVGGFLELLLCWGLVSLLWPRTPPSLLFQTTRPPHLEYVHCFHWKHDGESLGKKKKTVIVTRSQATLTTPTTVATTAGSTKEPGGIHGLDNDPHWGLNTWLFPPVRAEEASGIRGETSSRSTTGSSCPWRNYSWITTIWTTGQLQIKQFFVGKYKDHVRTFLFQSGDTNETTVLFLAALTFIAPFVNHTLCRL